MRNIDSEERELFAGIKARILAEHEAGESMQGLAHKYESSVTTIRNWKGQAKAKASESEIGESEVASFTELN